jgi:hypothetical protein
MFSKKNSKALGRDDILKVQDIEIERVDVPEWGGHVFVKGMTGTERDAFEMVVTKKRGKDVEVNMVGLRAKLIVTTVCDEDGKRLFTKKDVEKLGEKSASALQKVFEVAQRLSGLSSQDVEELTEGLDDDPFEDSPSD